MNWALHGGLESSRGRTYEKYEAGRFQGLPEAFEKVHVLDKFDHKYHGIGEYIEASNPEKQFSFTRKKHLEMFHLLLATTAMYKTNLWVTKKSLRPPLKFDYASDVCEVDFVLKLQTCGLHDTGTVEIVVKSALYAHCPLSHTFDALSEVLCLKDDGSKKPKIIYHMKNKAGQTQVAFPSYTPAKIFGEMNAKRTITANFQASHQFLMPYKKVVFEDSLKIVLVRFKFIKFRNTHRRMLEAYVPLEENIGNIMEVLNVAFEFGECF